MPDVVGGEQFWWFVARSTGIVAWALVVAALLWGTALATRSGRGWIRPRWTFAVHRTLGTLVVVTVGLHLAALVADSYVTFTLLDLLLPFRSDYRPLGVALGVIALWLLVVVQLGGRLRRRLPPRWWHGLHRTAYAVALLVSVHAALVGTDAFRGAYWTASALMAGLPLLAVVVRLRDAVRRRSGRPRDRMRTQPVPAAPAPVGLP